MLHKPQTFAPHYTSLHLSLSTPHGAQACAPLYEARKVQFISIPRLQVIAYSCGRGPLMLPMIKNSVAKFGAFSVLPVVPAEGTC
jgi:hypothetical protein